VLGAYAAWNGWTWWQRDQAVKAGAMFDEMDTAARPAMPTAPHVSSPT
jgi:hypothetical protein